MYPLVGICGKAGVGKDTVAAMLAAQGGVCIAQADPMKRFAHDLLGFSLDQLWGPSECRNALDERPLVDQDGFWLQVALQESAYALRWLHNIGLPNSSNELAEWLRTERQYARKNGLTPRRILQTLGTEFGRKQKDSVWVDYAQSMAARILEENCAYGRLVGPAPRDPGGKTGFVVVTDVRFRNEVLAIKSAGGKVFKVIGPNPIALAGDAGKHASETEQDGIPEFWFDSVIYNDKSKGFDALRGAVDMCSRWQLNGPPPVYGAGESPVAL